MNATIHVREQTVRCHIGCTEGERRIPQDIVVDLECDIDISRAMQTDELADTLDYAALHEQNRRLAEARSYNLVEAFASAIIEGCFAHPGVTNVRIRIEKPYKLAACRAVGLSVAATRPV